MTGILSMDLRILVSPEVSLYPQLNRNAQLGALNEFKTGRKSLPIATSIGNRPSVRMRMRRIVQ